MQSNAVEWRRRFAGGPPAPPRAFHFGLNPPKSDAEKTTKNIGRLIPGVSHGPGPDEAGSSPMRFTWAIHARLSCGRAGLRPGRAHVMPMPCACSASSPFPLVSAPVGFKSQMPWGASGLFARRVFLPKRMERDGPVDLSCGVFPRPWNGLRRFLRKTCAPNAAGSRIPHESTLLSEMWHLAALPKDEQWRAWGQRCK